MPKFSIVAVDYEYHVPRKGMIKGLNSILNQTFKDYELIIVHDGPKKFSYEKEFDFDKFSSPVKIISTEKRMNDWGHSSRDLGMRSAEGEYIFHFNIDNLIYPFCLEKINDTIEDYIKRTGSRLDVVIFTILHYKLGRLIYGTDNPYILSGNPPAWGQIDALQLVAHKSVWEKINYWYDKTETSDGYIYPRICHENMWIHIKDILGENY